MKHVSELVPTPGKALPAERTRNTLNSLASDADAGRMINDLIRELRAIFPAWKQAWPTADYQNRAKVAWTKAIVEAGISDWSMIDRGLNRCRQEGMPFIPSTGQFISYCWPTPEELGMPSEDDAYQEAVRNAHPSMTGKETWSHPGVYEAMLRIRRETLNTATNGDAAKLRFLKAYHDVCMSISRGEKVRQPLLALPDDVYRKGDPKKAASAIEQMRKALAGGGK